MSKIDKLIENGVKSLMIENLKEKAVSKNQQQFMGMVHAYKKGEMKDAPASVKKAAKGMTKKAAKDFASTKHKGLPTKVDEGVMSELDIELQDSKTFEEFLANVKSNPRFKSLNVDKPDVQEFLLDLFNQQKGSANESTLNEADEIGGYYLMSTLQDLADDSKRIGDTKMYDAYMYLHDRIEQSYRDIDLNQDDIKDILNEPQGRKHINNFPDWAIKDLFTESTKQSLKGDIMEALAPTNDLKSKMPDHVKGWAKWVAQHANGEWWYYDSMPTLVPGTGWKNNDRDGYQFGSGIKTAPQGWEKSSQELKENKMNAKTESIVKRLKEDTEYQKFFRSAMDKFGIKSPKDLSDKKKKEFFNYVDKNYKAKSE